MNVRRPITYGMECFPLSGATLFFAHICGFYPRIHSNNASRRTENVQLEKESSKFIYFFEHSRASLSSIPFETIPSSSCAKLYPSAPRCHIATIAFHISDGSRISLISPKRLARKDKLFAAQWDASEISWREKSSIISNITAKIKLIYYLGPDHAVYGGRYSVHGRRSRWITLEQGAPTVGYR